MLPACKAALQSDSPSAIFPNAKKTKSFKQTLLRRMVNDIKQKVNHIIFATATPMRTHPDEYYYLLELLGLDNFLSEIE